MNGPFLTSVGILSTFCLSKYCGIQALGPIAHESGPVNISNWVINSIKILMVLIYDLAVSTINISTFFDYYKYLHHIIIEDIFYGLGNLDFAPFTERNTDKFMIGNF